jgi:hypothetical protein
MLCTSLFKWIDLLQRFNSLRTAGFLRKIQKMYFFPENSLIEKLMVKCSSRPFQWMVMSVGFDNLKFIWAISVSRPWWQKSPSVLILGCTLHGTYTINVSLCTGQNINRSTTKIATKIFIPDKQACTIPCSKLQNVQIFYSGLIPANI